MFFGVDSTLEIKSKALLAFLLVLSALLSAIPFLIGKLAILILFSQVVAIIVFINSSSLKASIVLGFVWGLIFFGLQSFWINTLSIYAGVWAYVGWLALIAIEAAFIALYALGVKVIHKKRLSWLFSSLAIASIFVSIEILRSVGWWAYPWGLAAIPFADVGLLRGLFPITGWPGVSFAVIFISSVIAQVFPLPVGERIKVRGHFSKLEVRSSKFVVSIITLLLLLVFSPNPKPPTLNANASLIQTNVSMQDKWQRDAREDKFATLLNLASQVPAGADIVIGPETALPGSFPENKQLINKLKRQLNNRLIIGSLRKEGGRTYNAVFKGNDYYDKNNLVLFGEYIPVGFFANLIKPLQASLEAGGKKKLIGKTAVLICSESADWLYAGNLVSKGANFIAVSTNDAWFVGSTLPDQHLQLNRVRALENNRYVIAAANYGYSAIIAPNGQIIKKSKLGQDTVLSSKVALINKKTFFSKYGYLITVLFFVFGLGLLAYGLWPRI